MKARVQKEATVNPLKFFWEINGGTWIRKYDDKTLL